MDVFFLSTVTVLLAEIGDKTQLLAILLAARFNRAMPIIAGIFVATILNHAIAGAAGEWLGSALSPERTRWFVSIAFLAAAVWALIPDKVDDTTNKASAYGAFITSCIAFFLAENGDKTQLATAMLAAKYQSLTLVVIGTTLGMMLANIPAVLFGEAITRKLPLKLVRLLAAGLFVVLAVTTWLMVG